MSVKQTLTNVLSGYNIVDINGNFTLLNNALDNVLALDGTSPNSMSANFDMGGYDIINAGALAVTSLTVNGNPASGFDWQGAWALSTTYTVNQAVSHNGSMYIVTTNHTSSSSNEPGVGGGWDSVWDLTVSKGDTGATGSTGATGDGSGDVLGPATHSDNIVPRFNGSNNKTIQDSGISIDDSDNMSGVSTLEADGIGVGTSAVPHGAVGIAKLAVDGTDSNASGPHAQFTTDTDNYPTMQLLNWTHDNVGILYDCYFDGINWKSSDAGSNFRHYKNNDKLGVWYESGIAAGSNITWTIGWLLDSSGNLSIGTTTAEAKLHVEGAIRTDAATARVELLDSDAGDEFHIQNDGGVLKIINSTDSSRVDLQIDGDGAITANSLIREVNTQAGTSYTLVADDAGKKVRFTNSSAVTCTIPPNSDVAFPVGTIIYTHQNGTGAVTTAPGSGVTLNSRNSNLTHGARHVTVEYHKVATDEWDVIGDLV